MVDPYLLKIVGVILVVFIVLFNLYLLKRLFFVKPFMAIIIGIGVTYSFLYNLLATPGCSECIPTDFILQGYNSLLAYIDLIMGFISMYGTVIIFILAGYYYFRYGNPVFHWVYIKSFLYILLAIYYWFVLGGIVKCIICPLLCGNMINWDCITGS